MGINNGADQSRTVRDGEVPKKLLPQGCRSIGMWTTETWPELDTTNNSKSGVLVAVDSSCILGCSTGSRMWFWTKFRCQDHHRPSGGDAFPFLFFLITVHNCLSVRLHVLFLLNLFFVIK